MSEGEAAGKRLSEGAYDCEDGVILEAMDFDNDGTTGFQVGRFCEYGCFTNQITDFW